MMAFDPTLSCPIMKGITCAETECVFWDNVLLRCSQVNQAVTQNYNEITGALDPITGEITLDLGQIYRDVTVYVDWDTRVKFTNIANAPVDLTTANGRVGIPVLFQGINAQYVYLTGLDLPLNYIVTGNA
jgi:hypothetical protein